MHFFAQPTLGTDAEAVTDDQHPNHQGRIDRRPARVAVVGSEVLVQFAQVEEPVDPAQQVVGGNVVFQVERIEQRRLHGLRSEEHTYELQSLMRISYAVYCLTKKTTT